MLTWRKTIAFIALSALCLATHAQPQKLQLIIDEKSGLPSLTSGGNAAIQSGFLFWGANWSWAATEIKVAGDSRHGYLSRVENKPLDFDIASEIKPTDNEIVWKSTLTARKLVSPAVGGGMVFKFDLGNFGADMGDPVILPDNTGWRWGRTADKQMEMRFSPPIATVYFERGNKNEIRAFLFKDAVTPRQQSYTVTLTYGQGIELRPGISERFGGSSQDTWHADTVAGSQLPLDLSFLNTADKPAGKRGMIKAQGDKLVFADGQEARFWGTNVTAYALFNTPRDTVAQQAKRLSALGYNLVRIHHHDSHWVNPSIFGNKKFKKDTLTLDQAALDKLDWWIKCLKDEGIYVWLDLHVQRAFTQEDNIYAFDEFRKGKETADLKGFNYVNVAIQQAMKSFNNDYLNHVNLYTKTANKDEPAIVALLITNENDLTHHFGNSLLPDKNVPQHQKLYMSEANAFAKRTGLPADKVWRSWEHGPSKIFLNDLENRFNTDIIDHLRRIGSKAALVTTSAWGNGPLSSLPALTTGDLIDAHSYGGYGQLEKSPFFAANLTDWIAAAQVVGKPLSVTEWNAEPFPTPDRHTIPLFIGARAAHQSWDALMHYAYTQEAINGAGSPSNWHSHNDPSLLTMLSAAALMYRRGDVREANSTYVLDLGPEVFFNQMVSPNNATAIRTAVEKGKLLIAMPQTKELPWLERKPMPAGATVIKDFRYSVLPGNATESMSDTGELKRNWEKGTYTINTAKTQAAMGWIGGETIRLADTEFRFNTRNVAVAVQSLTDAPIRKSREIMISLSARSVPKPGNRAPFLVEPIEGQIRVNAPQGMKAYRKGPFNKDIELPSSFNNGGYSIALDGKQGVNWIFLR